MQKKLVLCGGEIITPLETRFTNLVIADQRIEELSAAAPPPPATIVDATGCYVTPGLIDLQVNGGPPCNFWGDPSSQDVQTFCEQLLSSGVTTILPTLITDRIEHVQQNVQFLRSLGVGRDEAETPQTANNGMNSMATCFNVRMPGIHLEGPCISPQRPGVHPKECLQPLTLDLLKQLISQEVMLITLAPELDSSGVCIEWLIGQNIAVALGHSNASFEEATAAFSRGIKLVTHTYNALPPLHHRGLGAVGAAMLEKNVSCCVICDGLHVDPTAVKLLHAVKGAEHMVLVTDIAHVGTSQGGLVGSSIYLNAAVRNVVKWEIASFREAILMSTLNPARAVGIDDRVGALLPGRLADVVVWDKVTLDIKYVFVGGNLVFGTP